MNDITQDTDIKSAETSDSSFVPGLELREVSHRYDGERKVLDDLNIMVGNGEIHAILGPSGCGKSTTLRLIAGLVPLQSGRIAIHGATIATPERQVSPEDRRVGLIFQDFALFPHLTVLENITFGLSHLPGPERLKKARYLLAQVGLSNRHGDRPHTLSGGEQQRVALARALAPEPVFMLLDEPFSALDANLRHEVGEMVISVLRERGTPALIVTHDSQEALRFCDHIHVMRHGRIEQSASPADLYDRPESVFVSQFFGPVNKFKGWITDGKVSTPAGTFSAPQLSDGTAVDVVVRPEGLVPCGMGCGGSLGAEVTGSLLLGVDCFWKIRTNDGANMIARIQGQRPADLNATGRIEMNVDPRHLFIFPIEQTAA